MMVILFCKGENEVLKTVCFNGTYTQAEDYINDRTEIPEGTGMLFVFENDDFRSFWMKDCPHPLSIAYILRDGTITDLLDMKPFSTASVNSSRSVRYALEVPQGWYEKAGIKTGDKVIIPKIKPEWQKESKLNKKAK